MIGIADRLTAKTVEGIVASSKEIEYVSGDTTSAGHSVADYITRIVGSTAYLSEETYDNLESLGSIISTVEYNIVEDMDNNKILNLIGE